VEEGATDVDLLLLRGEFRGVTPGTDMMRVEARFPGLPAIRTVGQAGLLTSEEGFAILSERSGSRVQAIWIEFLGSARVPRTSMRSADGRLRAGATEEEVGAWLAAHGLPVLLRRYPADEGEGAAEVREYLIDASRAWLEVREGRLAKAFAGDRHVYGARRRAAE
jgi:hypothetical protein